MPTPTNYETLSLKQLLKEQHAVTKAIERKVEEAEKAAPSLEAEAVTLINKLVAQKGLPPAKTDIQVSFQNGAKTAKGRKRKPIPVKFRDPNDASHTWTGRGRMPRWMTATGKPKEAFKVA